MSGICDALLIALLAAFVVPVATVLLAAARREKDVGRRSHPSSPQPGPCSQAE